MISRPGTEKRSRTWVRVLLIIPFIALLWPPFYSIREPVLFGIPFFYWFQLTWIFLTAIIITIVYFVEP
jgi:hypothetical protein